MKGYYELTEGIEVFLIQNTFVNNVTKGSLDKVINAKKDMYPLAHLIVNNAKFDSNVVVFNLSIIVMDLLDYTLDNVTDKFVGNNNEDDILNNTLIICQRFFEQARRGVFTDNYGFTIEDENADLEPFVERFTDDVAGWTMTLNITIPNEMTICY